MKRSIIIVSGFLCAFLVLLCGAEELPLWEAGLGFTGLSMPDYRGSNEQRDYLFPLPYLVYRGDILKLDRKGMRGLLFQSDRLELNISADGGVPVRSGRNSSRTNMPNLDPTLQIGPSFDVCLVRDCEADQVVQVRFPVRAVMATDLSGSTASVLSPIPNSTSISKTSDPAKDGILASPSGRSLLRNNTMIISIKCLRSTPFPLFVPRMMLKQVTAVH